MSAAALVWYTASALNIPSRAAARRAAGEPLPATSPRINPNSRRQIDVVEEVAADRGHGTDAPAIVKYAPERPDDRQQRLLNRRRQLQVLLVLGRSSACR